MTPTLNLSPVNLTPQPLERKAVIYIRQSIGNPPLKELMEGGEHPYGMQTFEKHIKQLVRDGKISRDAARSALGF